MKKRSNLLVLAALVSCASQIKNSTVADQAKPVSPKPVSVKPVSPTGSVISTTVPSVPAPVIVKLYKMPALELPASPSQAMLEAAKYYKDYGNTEEFYTYLRKNVTKLEGGNYTDVEKAIKDYRECLNKLKPLSVQWRSYGVWPLYISAAIGGWDDYDKVMYQNPKKLLNSVERAGHWYHETSHACGFTHVDNDITRYPIIRSSWPYQAGYLFEDYLTEKRRSAVKLAGE